MGFSIRTNLFQLSDPRLVFRSDGMKPNLSSCFRAQAVVHRSPDRSRLKEDPDLSKTGLVASEFRHLRRPGLSAREPVSPLFGCVRTWQ